MTGDLLFAVIIATALNCFLVTYCMLKEDLAYKKIYELGISVQETKERYCCYVISAFLILTTIAYLGYIKVCTVLIVYLLTLRIVANIGKKRINK